MVADAVAELDKAKSSKAGSTTSSEGKVVVKGDGEIKKEAAALSSSSR